MTAFFFFFFCTLQCVRSSCGSSVQDVVPPVKCYMWRHRFAGPYMIWLCHHETIIRHDVTLLQSFIKLVHISFLDSVMHTHAYVYRQFTYVQLNMMHLLLKYCLLNIALSPAFISLLVTWNRFIAVQVNLWLANWQKWSVWYISFLIVFEHLWDNVKYVI